MLKQNRVTSIYTTKNEMLIVKFSFSVLESVSLSETEAGGGDPTFSQSAKSIYMSRACVNVGVSEYPAPWGNVEMSLR